MAKALRVIAGPTAYQHIKNKGLKQQDITAMVGASGGPKWLSLTHLDQYLLNDFFAQRQEPLHLVGSSAGAWRFACYAHPKAAETSLAFAKAYQNICYGKDMTTAEITSHSRALLDVIYEDEASSRAAADNPIMKLHLVAARAKHLNRTTNRMTQMMGLTSTALANGISRRFLGSFFERVVFHAQGEPGPFTQWPEIPTQTSTLNGDNIRQVITASGAIPMVLEGVKDIPEARPGIYYDGGITDYHFDIPFAKDGLVLYPHFYPGITPGWFDKSLKWRKPNPKNFHNVVLLCPTEEWLQSLPQKRIPDRKDFVDMDDKDRIHQWGIAMDKSKELADDFHQFINGDLSSLELVKDWR